MLLKISMKKLLFLLLLLTTNQLNASESYRKNLKWDNCFYQDENDCCYSTKEYILKINNLLDNEPVCENNYISCRCKIMKGEWLSFYSKELIKNRNDIEIDHFIPASCLLNENNKCYMFGDKILPLKEKMKIYNDIENLVIATKPENRKKSNKKPTDFCKIEECLEKYAKLKKKYLKNE